MESLSDILQREYGIIRNPNYKYLRCGWSGPGGKECHICSENCPEGALPDAKLKKPDYLKCSKCDLCVALCPSKAIAPSEIRVREFLRAIASGDEVSIGCGRDEGKFTLVTECVAALSWEQIACAALRGGVTISLRRCKDCPHKALAAKTVEALDEVRRFLGDDEFFDKVNILEPGDEYEPRGNVISRRELFTLYKKMDPNRAAELLPRWDGKNDPPELFYRALLRDIIAEKKLSAEKGREPRYTVSLPRFTDACFKCRVCAQKCADRAISFLPSEDGESFLCVVEAWRCTSCGKCVEACPEKAISGLCGMSVTQLGQSAVKRCKVCHCSECGAVRKPSDTDGICGFCRIKKKAAEKRAAMERGEEVQ